MMVVVMVMMMVGKRCDDGGKKV